MALKMGSGSSRPKKAPSVKKMAKAEKAAKRKQGFRDFLHDYKKQLMSTGVIAFCCVVVMVIANAGTGFFDSMLTEKQAEIDRLKTETARITASDEAFTGIQQGQTAENLQINWVGEKIDTDVWRRDDDNFWAFIEPAFNYSSATEYNKMREDYISRGISQTSVFLAQFMPAFDLENEAVSEAQVKGISLKDDGTAPDYILEEVDMGVNCSASQENFESWPVAENEDGSIQYFALVFMSSKSGSGSTGVGFTYTMRMRGETPEVDDFACWPPSKNRQLYH